MVNSNFHLIRSKTLLTNDFELTVPDVLDHEQNRSVNIDIYGIAPECGLTFPCLIIMCRGVYSKIHI